MKTKLFLILIILFGALAFTPNTFAQDSQQWRLREETKIFFGKGYVFEIAYSPNDERLVVVSSIGTWLYDAQTGEKFDLLTGHTDLITCAKFSPDGKKLATGSLDGTIYLQDVETGTHLYTLTWNWGRIGEISFGPYGKKIVVSNALGFIELWDVNTGKYLRTLRVPRRNQINNYQALTLVDDFVSSIDFSPDGKTIVSGGSDKTVHLWNANTGQPIRTFIGHTDWVTSVVFSPDSKTIASGGFDNIIRLWNANTGQPIRTFIGHTDWVTSIVFSPDGKTIASGSGDRTIRLWNANTGQQHLCPLTGHTDSVTSVVFSPDGKTIASGGHDSTVLLWDIVPSQLPEDVNKDGIVNIKDLIVVANAFGETKPDLNGDGVADILDLLIVASAFGNTVSATEE